MSHKFKVGDVLKCSEDGSISIILQLASDDGYYYTNATYGTDGKPLVDECQEIEVYLDRDIFYLATELEKALL
jgi:hypothetical protein